MSAVLFAAGVAAAASCGGDREPEPGGATVQTRAQAAGLEGVRFVPELRVVLDSMMRTDNGVYIDDVRAGGGAVAEYGRIAVVEYRAWLPDGTLFERRPSDDGFGAAELMLGDGEPRGLHEGVAGMRTGGTRRIVVPPELGYDLVSRPPGVPRDSPLLFEVTLRAVR